MGEEVGGIGELTRGKGTDQTAFKKKKKGHESKEGDQAGIRNGACRSIRRGKNRRARVSLVLAKGEKKTEGCRGGD